MEGEDEIPGAGPVSCGLAVKAPFVEGYADVAFLPRVPGCEDMALVALAGGVGLYNEPAEDRAYPLRSYNGRRLLFW